MMFCMELVGSIHFVSYGVSRYSCSCVWNEYVVVMLFCVE